MREFDRKVLHAIGELVAMGGGEGPSIREVQSRVGSRSRSGIYDAVKALEAGGHIRRLPHRSRAIEVVQAPSHQWFAFNDATKALKPYAGEEAPR